MPCLSRIGGDKMNTPVRLQKETKESTDYSEIIMNKIESFALAHATLIFIVCFALLIALFVVLIFSIIGVSATESGNVYYHMVDVI